MSITETPPPLRTLDEQRLEFTRHRFLATPLAGALAWVVIGLGGLFLSPAQEVLLLFIATGSIVYVGIFFSRFTGEHFLDRKRPKNVFDRLFFYTVLQAVLVYAIAIPFFRVDYTSLPMSVGILAGLMWVPFSWIIGHWVGLFHGLTRTALVLAAWYAFPTLRFVVVPAVIVVIYAVTIIILENRWRRIHRALPIDEADDGCSAINL